MVDLAREISNKINPPLVMKSLKSSAEVESGDGFVRKNIT